VFTVQGNDENNGDGESYVAYLFAHNNDDGGFGEPGDQDIIKCGTYTGNNSTTGPVIDLGFEPQWIFIKHIDSGGGGGDSSFIFDNMRGVATGGGDPSLSPNAAQDEQNASNDMLDFNASGFQLKRANSNVNGDSKNYIYMAIRRGGMQTPTAASDVFEATAMSSSSLANTGFAVDMSIDSVRASSSSNFINDRLRGSGVYMNTDGTTAEQTGGSREFDSNQGVIYTSAFTGINWAWKRARGYFDIVAYSGTGSNRTVAHNLGVAPEMMWVRGRDDSYNWSVYHSATGNTKYLELDGNGGANTASASYWQETDPTSSVFSVGNRSSLNRSGENFIAYLFATATGVSKVGSFSHTNGSTTDVDCGFTGDTPSFVLLKRYNTTGSWVVFDSARGIVAGNDSFLKLDTTDAETTGNDVIDPLSGGFQVASGFLATGDWIFYAIAATS
jgi:hypothetical protein